MKTYWLHSKNPSTKWQRFCFYVCYPKDIYYNIRDIFFPRQRWIKKYITYTSWSDKTGLIPDFIFGCVIHFVDDEGAFEIIDWNSDPRHKEAAAIIKEVYQYAKHDRNRLEQEYLDALHKWSEETHMDFTEESLSFKTTPKSKTLSEKLDEIELLKDKTEKEMLEKTISVYQFLWT